MEWQQRLLTAPTLGFIIDSKERFSLGGAAHQPVRESTAVRGRAGERKTDWTNPHFSH
jgi:hypothetical protein